jgi:hypothetical protein
MTVALTLKVNDGLVLAADSASTMTSAGPGGVTSVINVYNNANKVFNLRKGLPIGLATWGLGSISELSIETLAKDLRRRFSGEEPSYKDWHLDPETYTIEGVAERVKEFMYDEKYQPAFEALEEGSELSPLGFFVVGYSANTSYAEEYSLLLAPAGVTGPTLLREAHQTGVQWAGQLEAVQRLLVGFGQQLGGLLVSEFGVAAEEVPEKLLKLRDALSAPVVSPAMPIQDAIELAEFLVDVSIKYSRFMPGSPTVGGPIECAAISKHEGFKWIKRKHYYHQGLNPQEGRSAWIT